MTEAETNKKVGTIYIRKNLENRRPIQRNFISGLTDHPRRAHSSGKKGTI